MASLLVKFPHVVNESYLVGDALWCLDRRQGKAHEQKRDQARPGQARGPAIYRHCSVPCRACAASHRLCMHAHCQRIRQSWRWVYVLPISRSLRLYLHATALARSAPGQPQTLKPTTSTPRTHMSFEDEERVCEVGGSTGVAQLGFSWQRLWLSRSQSQLASSTWSREPGWVNHEWMEQASFPKPVSAEGQTSIPIHAAWAYSQQPARTAFTRLPRQLGEATPEELPRPLAARLVSSEASRNPRLGHQTD